mgnify:CR=1 FL=1
MFVRLTGAPRPRVIAAAESSSPIFTEQVIIGISLYSNIFEDFFPSKLNSPHFHSIADCF